MWTSTKGDTRLSPVWVVAAAGLLCLFAWYRSGALVALWRRYTRRESDDDGRSVRTLRSSEWPIYDAKFNMSLSKLVGEPVVVVQHEPKDRRSWLFRLVNGLFYPEWRNVDTTVLINSLQWGKDTRLQRLMAGCTSRPPSIAAGKYLSRGKRITLMPHGPAWRQHQKAFARLLTKTKIQTEWAPAIEMEALVMVLNLHGQSCAGNVVEEMSRYTASVMLQIAYADRAPARASHHTLTKLGAIAQNMNDAFAPGNYLVDSFPLLDLLPECLSPWKRRLNAHHAFEMAVFRDLNRRVEMAQRGARDRRKDRNMVIPVERCATAQLHSISSGDDEGLDRDDVAYLAAGLFEAGSETTAMTLVTFLLGAAANPEWVSHVKKQELADHFQRASPPRFDELDTIAASGSVLAGFVREALRLTPTCSSGMAHTTRQARSHRINVHGLGLEGTAAVGNHAEGGVRVLEIPAGASVLANIYGLHHDTDAFPYPWQFDPGRWATALENGTTQPPQPTTRTVETDASFAFGFGVRRCPGSRLASYSLTMAITLLLWAYTFDFDEDAVQEVCAKLEADEGWDLGGDPGWLDEAKGPARHRRRRHMVLVDAYATHRIQGSDVAKCVRLMPREEGEFDPREVIERTMASIRRDATGV